MITKEKVKELIASINKNINADDLKNDVELSDQGVESLDTFDLFLQVEEEYGVEVSDELIMKLNTIEKIVDYVNEHK